MITDLFTWCAKTLLVLLVLTGIGQIPVQGYTLENRYHDLVNSRSFQKSFETVTRPVTWTSERVSELIQNARTRAANKLSSR